MEISHVKTRTNKEVIIELVLDGDYKKITKSKYWFNWKTEKEFQVYKLRLVDSDEILGLISLITIESEERIEINLLAVIKENRGRAKTYDGIAGNLIAYACREAIKLYGIDGCVSLVPKTELRSHSMKKYGMIDTGWQLFLEGKNLINQLNKFKV